ncbi:MAG: trimethylamine methyltransferase family protein [Alphaproteobacteria bacterium]
MTRTTSRRARRQGGSEPTELRQLPWRQPVNPYRPVEVLSADQIETIHRASLRVLAETGIWVMHEPSRRRLKAAGARVDESNQRVRFDPVMIEEQVAKAPSEVTIQARNRDRSLRIGGQHTAFSNVGGPPYFSTLDGGRQKGSFKALGDFLKIAHSLNIVHQLVPALEPLDLPTESRYLDTAQLLYTTTDKSVFLSAAGTHRARDGIALAAIANGTTAEHLNGETVVMTGINTNSPLMIDVPMAAGITAYAKAGQLAAITPFTLSGAMSPVTLAGALVQQNAEALAGITLAQVVRAGAPVAYGAFTTNVDMRSGAPAFGTPEYMRTMHASGQLARRYGLPFRASNTTASQSTDIQSTYESAMSLWGTIMGGVNFVFHAAGWLESGLNAGFEKLIVDAEMLQIVSRYFEPIATDDASLAVEAIAEVGPGGHFFGVSHTLERYETAFYEPLLSDWRNYEAWAEAGSQDALKRANGIWKSLLHTYEAPTMDPARAEAMEAYVAKRKEAIAAGEGPDVEPPDDGD